LSNTIDLIRESAVSAETMRAAARGALPVSAGETIEILVFLTTNPVFHKQARMTLASWDVKACSAVLSDPASPKPVLDYFLSADNRRPALLSALLENPSVPEPDLLPITQENSREVVTFLLASSRVMMSHNLLNALIGNPVLTPEQVAQIRKALESPGDDPAALGQTYDYEEDLDRYLMEHASEIAAEEGKAFELVKDPDEPDEPDDSDEPVTGEEEVPAVLAGHESGVPQHNTSSLRRLSVYQRISRMAVGERVQLAMKGSREERFILIRDGSKVVSSAVLESPKVTDQEVETFASMKNVQETVLRGIASKRKFLKDYAVIRNLANNPRCPLDVQLTLMKNLLNNDLRAVSANKNIADTVRKLALKMFKERTEKKR
jgi:hypothetical protein